MVPCGLHWHWTWDPPSSTLLVLGFQACDAVFKVYTVLKITPSNQHCGPSHCIMGRRVHLTSKSYSLPRVEGEKCTGGTKEGTRRGYKIYTPGLYIKKKKQISYSKHEYAFKFFTSPFQIPNTPNGSKFYRLFLKKREKKHKLITI